MGVMLTLVLAGCTPFRGVGGGTTAETDGNTDAVTPAKTTPLVWSRWHSLLDGEKVAVMVAGKLGGHE